MTELPPRLKERVLADVAGRPSLTRSQDRRRRSAWLAVGLAVLTGAGVMHGIPRVSVSRPVSHFLICVAMALIVAIWATVWLLRPSGGLGGRRSSSLVVTAAVPVLLALGVVAANIVQPRAWALGDAWLPHLMCFSLYAELGAALFLVFLVGLRPFDPVAPRTTGAAVGAVVGAWTTLAVSVHCPSPAPGHSLLAHVAPGLLLIGLGALVGPRILGVRYRARP